ncbi:hypothetical protein BH09BAC2_BH09BAC2_03620 [soil metagenome]
MLPCLYQNYEHVFREEYKGGFDVVIGNPPWGAVLDSSSKVKLAKTYPIIPAKLKDSYLYFMLMTFKIIKQNSFYGLIIPNTWLLINNADKFRKEILSYDVKEIIDYGDGVFEDAIVESSSLILKSAYSINDYVFVKKFRKGKEIISQALNKNIWLEDSLVRIQVELKESAHSIITKMKMVSEPFEKTSEIIFGIKPYQVNHGTPAQTQEIINNRVYHARAQYDESWKPLITGVHVSRYCLDEVITEYIKYGKWLMYSSDEKKILQSKILLRRTSDNLKAVLDESKLYPQNSIFIITSKIDLRFLLLLLNSKLFDFIYKAKCPQVGKVFAEVKPSIIKELPISKKTLDNNVLQKADIMFVLNKGLNLISQQFQRTIERKFELTELPKKLQHWYLLSYADFIKELAKKKVKLSLAEEAEWETYFLAESKKALELKNKIETTDKEIDQMVYNLYNLTPEEIKIVEGEND